MKGEWSWTEMAELLQLKAERQMKDTHFNTARPVDCEVNGLPHYVLREGKIVKA